MNHPNDAIGEGADSAFMRLALEEAEKARGRTAPNPMVGCVVLDRHRNLVGRGFHERAGQPHAEVVALEEAGEAARGGTLYVTLEPCSHWGRTPPCADAILRAGIARVVAAMEDPDPRVAGAGFLRLLEAGVEVAPGVEEEAARKLNEAYLKAKRKGLPFLLLKMAMTLDGRTATRSGDSKWITSPVSRSHVQLLRDQYDAVMVGIGTVLRDDPRLTVRPGELPDSVRSPRNPVRVVLDSRARLPLDANVLHAPGRTIVLATEAADPRAVQALRGAGAIVETLESEGDRVGVRPALEYLVSEGIHSVLSEGGAEVAGSLLEAGLVDRVLFFLAPKLLGDREAPGPVGGVGPLQMSAARPTAELRVLHFPPDIAIETDL